MTRQQVLDRYFLQTRCKLIEVAAALDRLDRAPAQSEQPDPRLEQLRQAVRTLGEQEPGRAERLQMIFSRPYDPDWRR